MTDQQMNELLVLLDQLWDGVDAGREAGYRWLLLDEPYELVEAAVKEMAHEDRHWLPRAPEVWSRVEKIAARRRNDARVDALLEKINRGRLSATDPAVLETGKG